MDILYVSDRLAAKFVAIKSIELLIKFDLIVHCALCIMHYALNYSQLPELLLGSTTEPTLRPLKRLSFVCLSLRLMSC